LAASNAEQEEDASGCFQSAATGPGAGTSEGTACGDDAQQPGPALRFGFGR